MDCPHCGYARSVFDIRCPRCQRLTAVGERRVYRPAEETVIVPELSAHFDTTPRGLNLWAVSLLVMLALGVGIYIGRLTAPQPVQAQSVPVAAVSVPR